MLATPKPHVNKTNKQCEAFISNTNNNNQTQIIEITIQRWKCRI